MRMWREQTEGRRGRAGGPHRELQEQHRENSGRGIQGQFRGTGDDTTTDGVGGSLQLKFLPGVKAGGTYTRTNAAPSTLQIRGMGGNSDYMAVGTRIDWKVLEFGAVYSRQHNGDLLLFLPPTLRDKLHRSYSTHRRRGVRARGLGRFGLIGGYTLQDPKVRDPIAGSRVQNRVSHFGRGVVFCEKRQNLLREQDRYRQRHATGEPGYNVFTIGFRYDFSWRTSHQP